MLLLRDSSYLKSLSSTDTENRLSSRLNAWGITITES